MTDTQRWKAARSSNAACDGRFFYAVKTTGVFCRPSCKSRVPRRENVTFFDTAAQAQKAGYRPCKRCRPDLPAYNPQREAAEKMRAWLDEDDRRERDMDARLAVLGLTRHRMAQVFKEEFGVTMGAYRRGQRLARAKALLAQTGEPVAQVAFAAGFESLPAFYRFFKKYTGTTPAAYRKAHSQEKK